MSDPDISIVIPARNEEQQITGCLNSILASASEADLSAEIIVVLNRSSDKTEDIARHYGANIIANDSRNLSAIRNQGIAAASAPFIVTIDADSRMSLNLLEQVYSKLSSGNTIAGGTMIFPERYSPGIIATGVCIFSYLILRRISVGCFFLTKELFLETGGFNEELKTAEDIDFALRLRKAARGKSKSYSNLYTACITTSCRKFDQFGDWYLIGNPIRTARLLSGRSQELGDKYWY